MNGIFEYERKGRLSPARRIVLMSGSPRRQALLQELHPRITQVSVAERAIQERFFEENRRRPFLERAARTCCELARAKSGDEREEESLYISADTMVLHHDEIYNKPLDEQDAYRMLYSYFGQVHHVVTAVCLREGANYELFYSLTAVRFVAPFEKLSQELWRYIQSGGPMDKAGAYGIQEIPCAWVEKIEGDYETIIGLPVSEVIKRISMKGEGN
ncbi:MAG: Maf family protein [Ndongobacter sp.]|nr:Maf family protein [Ndongobacter sp.]